MLPPKLTRCPFATAGSTTFDGLAPRPTPSLFLPLSPGRGSKKNERQTAPTRAEDPQITGIYKPDRAASANFDLSDSRQSSLLIAVHARRYYRFHSAPNYELSRSPRVIGRHYVRAGDYNFAAGGRIRATGMISSMPSRLIGSKLIPRTWRKLPS